MIPEVPFAAQQHKLLSHVHRIINPANSKLNDRLPNINRDNLINVPPNIWWSLKTQSINIGTVPTNDYVLIKKPAADDVALRRDLECTRRADWEIGEAGCCWTDCTDRWRTRRQKLAGTHCEHPYLQLLDREPCRHSSHSVYSLHHILLKPDKFSLGASFLRVLINYYTNQL